MLAILENTTLQYNVKCFPCPNALHYKVSATDTAMTRLEKLVEVYAHSPLVWKDFKNTELWQKYEW